MAEPTESLVTADVSPPAAQGQLVVIQRNPTSGAGRVSRQLIVLIRELQAAGLKVRLFASRERFDGFVNQPDVRRQLRCAVAAGGDGTVAGLANRHPDLTIAAFPMGTENLLARHLNMPCCGKTVARMIVQGATRRFDTAFLNDQRFLLMASVGVDADVVRRMHSSRQGNIRHLSYVQPIFSSILLYPYPQLTVYSADGQLLGEGSHVIVTNIPEYGFRIPFCPQASAHDGLLDIRIFHLTGRWATMTHGIRTRLGFDDRSIEVTRLKAPLVEIRSQNPDTVSQCDGDPGSKCPARISVAPASLNLIVRPS